MKYLGQRTNRELLDEGEEDEGGVSNDSQVVWEEGESSVGGTPGRNRVGEAVSV